MSSLLMIEGASSCIRGFEVVPAIGMVEDARGAGRSGKSAASPRYGALVCAGEFARAFLWVWEGLSIAAKMAAPHTFGRGAPSNRCSKAASALYRRKQQGRGRPCRIVRRNWRSPRRGDPTMRPRRSTALPVRSQQVATLPLVASFSGLPAFHLASCGSARWRLPNAATPKRLFPKRLFLSRSFGILSSRRSWNEIFR